MPPRLPRCSAFSLNKSYSSVSGFERETSIRIPSALIFMWCGLFRWQRKWLNAEKDLSSSAVDSFAMNSFQTSSCCVFQVRYYKLHKQNVSDGLAHCADLAATVTGAKVRCTCSDEHCITQIGPKAKNRLLCTEASMMSPSCYLIP